MKRQLLLILALGSLMSLKAQWVNDPENNTFVANCSGDDSELYTSTVPGMGDTYVQWCSFGSNGWAPCLQRLSFDGTPQWGPSGIPITTPNLESWSPGYAMAATTDGGVVSMFRTADEHHWAVKINADGSFPWGEYGIMLFDGLGGSRSEVIAGNDGGVWALGTDLSRSYLQYIQADGTMGPIVTISDPTGASCTFGKLTLTYDNSVLLTYEKSSGGKQLFVVGVTPQGDFISPESLLMSEQTFQSTYIHHAVSDGQGGGYAYIWHPAIGDAFNTYVFHFNELGLSTIDDLNGIPVHSLDPSHYYGNAYATADPLSHDLIIAYEETDAATQHQSRVFVNRITPEGEVIWGDGIMVADYVDVTYSDLLVDAFEDGSGFTVLFTKSSDYNPYFTTIMAVGMDMEGNQLWTTVMSSTNYRRTLCKNSPGFHQGQNMVAWVKCMTGGIYAQNITPDGTMGPIEPALSCLAPENFQGEYVFDMDEQLFGTQLSWRAPATQPLHYNLYRHDATKREEVVIEVEANANSYLDDCGTGTYTYQLTAVYEQCESDFALTPIGEDQILIEVTGIEEQFSDRINQVLGIYTMKGQRLTVNNMSELPSGVYILQGLTDDGSLVSKKVIITQK